MKQHITSEQLNKLSEKGKEKLREWWVKSFSFGGLTYCTVCRSVALPPEFSKVGTCYSRKHPECSKCKTIRERVGKYAETLGLVRSPMEDRYVCYHNRDNCTLPLLSIGQMIEFLDPNSENSLIVLRSFPDYAEDGVKRGGEWGLEYGRRAYQATDLVDVLWEATKEILNRDALED